MTKKKKNNILETASYLLVFAVISLILAYIGIFLVAKTFDISNLIRMLCSISSIIFVCFALMFFYAKYKIKTRDLPCSVLKGISIIVLTIIISVLINVSTISFFSAYATSVVLVALMVTIMLNESLGIMSTLMTALITLTICIGTKQGLGESLSYQDTLGIINSLLAGFCMIFVIRARYSRFKLTIGTILVAICAIPFLILGAMTIKDITPMELLFIGLKNFLGDIIGITMFTILLPLYEIGFRIWTDFKLAELCSFNQPLLKKIREEAPGTFNHSLTVGNLMESCAMAIGLNPYMARACAYFHDIGKIKNPQFFVENQKDGYNPHDELIPEVSASMITRHTTAGAEILRANHMPDTIIKAASEHHGDTPVMYFYLKAKGITEGDLDIEQYRYSGPMPTTKYSAVLMICDVCEAMTRSKNPDSQEALAELVGNVIKEKMLDGQFDQCDLTVKDMAIIKSTICDVIPAMLHKRIDYNKAKERR